MIQKRKALFSHKTFYTLVGLLLLSSLSYLAYSYTQNIPDPGHGADTILITINGQEKTLQDALDAGDFVSAPVNNTPGGGGGSGTLLCFDGTTCNPGGMEDLYQEVGIGTDDPNKKRCCGVVDPLAIETAVLEVGADNDGGGDPDCWIISEPGSSTCGTPNLPPPNGDAYSCSVLSCSAPQHGACVKETLKYYNGKTINGVKGGWLISSWEDTKKASPCKDSTSDKLEITLIRP